MRRRRVRAAARVVGIAMRSICSLIEGGPSRGRCRSAAHRLRACSSRKNDEIFDRVVGERIPELAIYLGGQRLFGAPDQRRRWRGLDHLAKGYVLPLPLTPSSTWVRSCAGCLYQLAIAVGLSPLGGYSDLISNLKSPPSDFFPARAGRCGGHTFSEPSSFLALGTAPRGSGLPKAAVP